MAEPRVPPLKPDELDDRQQRYLEPFTDAKGHFPNLFGVLARHMPLLDAWTGFGLYTMQGSRVDPVLREVLILRTAQHMGSPYERHHHRRIGKALGMSEALLDQSESGASTGNDDHDLMIACADSLAQHARLPDDVWSAMIERFGLETTLDAIFTVGAYTVLAMAVNSCDVTIEGRG